MPLVHSSIVYVTKTPKLSSSNIVTKIKKQKNITVNGGAQEIV